MKKKDDSPPVAAAEAEGVETAVSPTVTLRSQILATLGRPPYLYKIQIARLWENTYRANVLVGNAVDTIRCAHSYFVETTDAGVVVTSTPKLNRVYT